MCPTNFMFGEKMRILTDFIMGMNIWNYYGLRAFMTIFRVSDYFSTSHCKRYRATGSQGQAAAWNRLLPLVASMTAAQRRINQ